MEMHQNIISDDLKNAIKFNLGAKSGPSTTSDPHKTVHNTMPLVQISTNLIHKIHYKHNSFALMIQGRDKAFSGKKFC